MDLVIGRFSNLREVELVSVHPNKMTNEGYEFLFMSERFGKQILGFLGWEDRFEIWLIDGDWENEAESENDGDERHGPGGAGEGNEQNVAEKLVDGEEHYRWSRQRGEAMTFDEAVEEEREVGEAGSNYEIRKQSLWKRIGVATLSNAFIVFTAFIAESSWWAQRTSFNTFVRT